MAVAVAVLGRLRRRRPHRRRRPRRRFGWFSSYRTVSAGFPSVPVVPAGINANFFLVSRTGRTGNGALRDRYEPGATDEEPPAFVTLLMKKTVKVADNPADQLVATLNNNRTAHKGTSLFDNPGLACIALQYIKAYEGHCDLVGGSDAKKPKDSAFAENFAPACGVSPSTLSPITGRLLGCQSKYVHPEEAFSEILMKNGKGLDILYNKNHTEVGAAVSGSGGGGPYFWCLLFSNGKGNSSFVVEGGVAKDTKPGCFSGANDDCSGAYDWSRSHLFLAVAVGALLTYAVGM